MPSPTVGVAGVELGHRDPISVFYGSCLFLLCFYADWLASNCTIAGNSFSFYNRTKVFKKAHKCSVLLVKFHLGYKLKFH